MSAEAFVVGLDFEGGASKALLTPAPIVNQLPTKTQSPRISMELLDSCIMLLMRSLLSLWWSKVWPLFRLETQRVNTLNRAAMDRGLKDWSRRIRYRVFTEGRNMSGKVKG
ncbi:hypothetical protein AYO43_01105 [Nitrospira sp. SCGC AG-212-E16]|nr:hypothetical protein AYO43_01105 [Nitrospira sp. SCGC AG-212-E16]